MPMRDLLRGVLVMVALGGFAGGAAAFDAGSLSAETAPAEALEHGLNSYRSGDKQGAAEALGFAADKGNPIAQWKLGRMYADGDGITRDDYKAFELFSEMAGAHADDTPGQPNSRFVSNAFVALGGYYHDGIPDTDVKQDLSRARQIYAYAASYFGDPEAQAKLAWMYFNGEGGERDPLQAARWAKLAADKGDVNAQALLGHVLFEGEGVPRQPVLGLMYLTIARDEVGTANGWIHDMQERAVSVATENERRTAMALADDWRSKTR
ncbi:MAG: sel1 repeat family protein [Hyphomicrobiales bacterium]|nr:sel1 repeat family protein [Hyphomicrobiales bacterium]